MKHNQKFGTGVAAKVAAKVAARVVVGLAGLALIGGGALCVRTMAQSSSSSNNGSISGPHIPQGALSQDQFNKLADYADQAKRLTKEDKANGKTLEDLLKEDRARAEALVKAMPLACEIADAKLAASGEDTVDGKKVNTHTYEVACKNGMGYFLIDVDGGTPSGFSCLAAEATRQADVAAGRKPGTVCSLTANLKPETLATGVLAQTGIACPVDKIRSIGINSKVHLEYNELACQGGGGYILITALPGQTMPPRAMSCHDAAMKGLTCQMTDAGPVLTKQTFIDALAANKVSCTANPDRMHVFGLQNTQKRYVVEFACPEQPQGLVAFIPQEGSKGKFETKSCKEALKAGVTCTFTHE